jgi:hypothetical protein
VLALVIYLLRGPRTAIAEPLAELLLGLVLLGRTGLRPIVCVLRLLEAMVPRRSAEA